MDSTIPIPCRLSRREIPIVFFAVQFPSLFPYKEIKLGYDSEVEELKEWLELSNNNKANYRKEIEKLRSKIKNLEEDNH